MGWAYNMSTRYPTQVRAFSATKTSPGRRNPTFKQFLDRDIAAQELPVCRLCATTRRSRRAAFGTGRIDDIAANIGRREPTDAPGSAVTDYHLCSGGRWQMTFALAIDR